MNLILISGKHGRLGQFQCIYSYPICFTYVCFGRQSSMMSEDAEALPGREQRRAGVALAAEAGDGTGTPNGLSPFLPPRPRNDSAFASFVLLVNKLTKIHQDAFR